MPGANCSIFDCGTSSRNTGVGIFRLPSGKDKKSKQVSDEWIKVITRDRVVDANFRKIIEAGNVMCAKNILKRRKSNVVSIIPFFKFIFATFFSAFNQALLSFITFIST